MGAPALYSNSIHQWDRPVALAVFAAVAAAVLAAGEGASGIAEPAMLTAKVRDLTKSRPRS